MGNWPSISLVLRRIGPCPEDRLVGEQTTQRPPRRRPRRRSGPARAAPGPGCSPRARRRSRLQLGRLHREPVGVGGDHRHLLAAGADQDAGQDRAHVVPRGGAGDQVDGLAPAPRPGSSAGSPSARGTAGSPRPAGVRRWKLEPPLRISTSRSASRSSISTARRGSERATSASRRPGSRTEPAPSTSASSVVSQPELQVGRAERRRRRRGGEQDAGERLGRGPGGDRPGDDESLETSSSRLVVSFN